MAELRGRWGATTGIRTPWGRGPGVGWGSRSPGASLAQDEPNVS